MKRILKWLVDGYHWVHVVWGIAIPLCGAYIFFTEQDMNWKIDAITAIIFAPFVAFGILLYQSMFRKKAADPSLHENDMDTRPADPIHQARKSAR
jgi:choline-glycine betaine transporter